MEFLTNLEHLMDSYNMNRSELARACGFSTSTVNSWWNRSCENITLPTLMKIANYFNCSIEELVNGKPSLIYTYDTNEYSTEELELIYKYAQFLKSSRVKEQHNDD